MPRPRLHDEKLRLKLLAQAARTVATSGISALSLRSLAADVGTSTTAVYSLFGGKPGLLEALYEDSFAGFGAAQRAVPATGDSLADLAALGRAYWTWAREHPDLYGVLFSRLAIDLAPSEQQVQAAQSTIEPLTDMVRSAVATGQLCGDVATITFSIWAAVHGAVSLVLAHCGPDDDAMAAALFDATAGAVARGWSAEPPQPDPPAPAG